MSNIIKIKKGLDIPLKGIAPEIFKTDNETDLYGIVPDDYPGYTWKAAVKAGAEVKAGSPLLFAKEDERLCLTSPVAGVVQEIHRGERRKIEYISVKKEGEQTQEVPSFAKDKDSRFEALLRTGLFALLRQRPFDIVAQTDSKPRDIFVTAFDSAPLAADMLTEDMLPDLEVGLKTLADYTEGKVYISVRKGTSFTSSVAEVYEFEGPHPAGNVGVQIAAIRPVNKGETVWCADAVTVCRIGKLMTAGTIDYTANIAITGPEVKEPNITKTLIGASLKTLLKGELDDSGKHLRVISGNVLTGVKENPNDGFVRYPFRQITVIEEGDNADEFMGWASMNPGKFSVKHSFPAFLRGLGKPFNFDARIKGGHRAMILSGEYDKVFPMDIYPEYLIKAMMAKDIERMEQLGIYEVAPEDFALPEFVDTSKIELQKLVRDSLDYLRKETM